MYSEYPLSPSGHVIIRAAYLLNVPAFPHEYAGLPPLLTNRSAVAATPRANTLNPTPYTLHPKPYRRQHFGLSLGIHGGEALVVVEACVRRRYAQKEPYIAIKRALQYDLTEPYSKITRALHCDEKSPILRSKEPYITIKRALHCPDKSPISL